MFQLLFVSTKRNFQREFPDHARRLLINRTKEKSYGRKTIIHTEQNGKQCSTEQKESGLNSKQILQT